MWLVEWPLAQLSGLPQLSWALLEWRAPEWMIHLVRGKRERDDAWHGPFPILFLTTEADDEERNKHPATWKAAQPFLHGSKNKQSVNILLMLHACFYELLINHLLYLTVSLTSLGYLDVTVVPYIKKAISFSMSITMMCALAWTTSLIFVQNLQRNFI